MGFMDVLGKIGGIAGGPLGALAGGVLGNIFGKDPQQAESDAYNQWLSDRRSGVDRLTQQLVDRGWDPFGVNELSGSSYGTSYGTQDSTTRGSEAQQQRKVAGTAQQARTRDMIDRLQASRLGQGRSEAEKIAALVNINNQTRAAQQAAANKAGIRGLGAMQSYGAMAGPEQQAAAARIAYLDPKNDLMRNLMLEGEAQKQAQLWQGADTNRQYQSRTTGQTTSNQFGGGTNQVAPNMGALANLYLDPSPQATAGGLTQNKLTDILGGANQALAGLYGGQPTQPVQQLPAARNYTSSVFGR